MKKPRGKRKPYQRRLSLAPLRFEEALEGLLQTPPPPKQTKQKPEERPPPEQARSGTREVS